MTTFDVLKLMSSTDLYHEVREALTMILGEPETLDERVGFIYPSNMDLLMKIVSRCPSEEKFLKLCRKGFRGICV